MKCDLEQYSKIEIDEAKRKIKRIQKRLKEFGILKEKLEKQFDFEIVDYIIYDILDEETYYHTCLMINLAVLNNRLSIENGEQLKQGLKDLFKINNSNDKIDKKIYIGNYIDFDKYSENEQQLFRNYISFDGSTPVTLFIKNGGEETTVNRINGNVSKDKIISKFKSNGFIK